MKRIFSLLMAAALLCALTACGNNGNDTPTQPAASTPTGSPDNAASTEIISTPAPSEPAAEPDDPSASDGTGKGVLKDLSSMRRFCDGGPGAIEGGICCQNYGFVLETERYIYRLRCNPVRGDYQAYLSCFDKHAQKLEYSLTEGRRQMLLDAADSDKQEQAYGLTEKGRQMLLDAADPGKPHSYGWYVIENINDPERRIDHTLPLEEAVQMYISLDCEDKRMGVTKDGIASVDLAIRLNGREWLPEDYRKSARFAQDPVVAGAVTQLQQAMEDQTHGQGMAMGGMKFG